MTGDKSAYSQPFAAANAQMHADKTLPLTPDIDIDFISGMIPHHHSAVDAPKIVMQNSKDSKVCKVTEGLTATQKAETTQMKSWAAHHKK